MLGVRDYRRVEFAAQIEPYLKIPGHLPKCNPNPHLTLRREILNAEWFATTRQAQTVINQWLRQYNHVRPHHALGMRPPIPETILVKGQITGTEQGG
jgi:transposase InsO family protein